MHLMLFEDHYFSNFKPLTYTRAVFELKCGMLSFLDRAVKIIPHDKLYLYVRRYLEGIVNFRRKDSIVNSIEKLDDDLILINGRLILNEKLRHIIDKLINNRNVVFISDNYVVAASLSNSIALNIFSGKEEYLVGVEDFLKFKDKLEFVSIGDASLILNLWDLTDFNHELLIYDFKLMAKEPRILGDIDDRAIVYGDNKRLYVGSGAVIEGNVNIDLRGGPVYIDENVEIQGPSSIHGPCYIGRNTRIVSGARIRSDCSIGETCRIGGEVESSIFHGFSNMYHAGFMGHSYVGEWVNIGALTSNSDLKNTYGSVKMRVNGEEIDTGRIKVGCFIGDHAKTSIGCLIYTGRIIGVSSHLHGVIFDDVPSFTIYARSLGIEPVELNLESAIRTMIRMYKRRGRSPREVEVELMRKVYELTRWERREFEVRRGLFSFRKT